MSKTPTWLMALEDNPVLWTPRGGFVFEFTPLPLSWTNANGTRGELYRHCAVRCEFAVVLPDNYVQSYSVAHVTSGLFAASGLFAEQAIELCAALETVYENGDVYGDETQVGGWNTKPRLIEAYKAFWRGEIAAKPDYDFNRQWQHDSFTDDYFYNAIMAFDFDLESGGGNDDE